MRSLSLVILSLLLLSACTKPGTVVAPAVSTQPTSTTAPISITTVSATPRGTLPAGVDLYAQFAQPFPASATQRLQEIRIFKDSILIASSTLRYNQAGQLESRRYLDFYTGYVYQRISLYTYDTQGRLLSEVNSNGTYNNPATERIYKTLSYTYADNKLVSVIQKTPHPSFDGPPTLSGYTAYQYPGQGIRESVRLGYQCNVCGINLPVPTDSARQQLITDNRLTTRIDSNWAINRPYNGPVSASFFQRLTEETSRDDKGNALSIRTVTTLNWSPTPQTTTIEQAFTHQYDGRSGLISSSVSPSYGLRYEFIYEPK